MKKALVVLLLLAVAGGLFAQVTFSGGVYSGLGLAKKGAADPTIGLNSVWNGSDGLRAQLNTSFTGADGNYGFFGRIRASAATLGGIGDNTGFAGGAEINQIYGWMSGFNGLVKAWGGRMAATQTMHVDAVWADSFWGNAVGLQGYVYPIAGLTIGAGVRTGLAATAGLMDNLNWWAGAKYVGTGIAFAAEFDYLKDTTTRVGFSADYTGIDILDIDAAARIEGLHVDNGMTMRFDEHVGLNLIENVGIHLYGREQTTKEANEDMLIGVGAKVDYTFGKMLPALEVGYVQAATFDQPGLAGRQWGDPTGDSNSKFISVSPSVKYSTTAKSYFLFGYTLGFDIGDVAAAGSDADNPMNHALFLDFVVEF